MQIKVLLFAGLADTARCDAVALTVSDDATAGDVMAALRSSRPELADSLSACRLAFDCCYVASDHPVASVKEIAVIPPVSGG